MLADLSRFYVQEHLLSVRQLVWTPKIDCYSTMPLVLLNHALLHGLNYGVLVLQTTNTREPDQLVPR